MRCCQCCCPGRSVGVPTRRFRRRSLMRELYANSRPGRVPAKRRQPGFDHERDNCLPF
jgi:hypothetical protein